MANKQKITNEETVVAYTDKGTMVEWKMGQLKTAFLQKKLDYRILFIRHPKTNKCFRVVYAPTKGFKFVEHDPTKPGGDYHE